MSLRRKIEELFKRGTEISVTELYEKFPDEKKTTVRGRLYDCLGKTVKRAGRGLYVSVNAIAELGDAMVIVDRLVKEESKFDFVFLDLPYQSPGTIGGNRNLAKFNTISPEQFKTLVDNCSKLLRTEDSYIMFMFTGGKSSIREYRSYVEAFNNTDLQKCAAGTFQKIFRDGKIMNMGKYPMPVEYIELYNKSGKFESTVPLNYRMTPPRGLYPTAKPFRMMRTIIKNLTNRFDSVLDPFAGSGVMVKACKQLERFCYAIDCSSEAMFKHILPAL